MAPLQATTAILGVSLAGLILYLIRRNHLYLMHGLFWVLIAASAAVLGVWPGLVDWLASMAGIAYPPALLLLMACMVLIIKALHSDMLNTRIERDLRRINQHLAIVESEISRLRSSSSEAPHS